MNKSKIKKIAIGAGVFLAGGVAAWLFQPVDNLAFKIAKVIKPELAG